MNKNTALHKACALKTTMMPRQSFTQKDLHRAMTAFAQQRARESTHHIILATHRPMTMEKARYSLQKWDKLMNGQILGGRWNNKHHLHCEWVAFPEHVHSDPHWHLLWKMSDKLEVSTVNRMLRGRSIHDPKYDGRIKGQMHHGLKWIVHRHWANVVSSGTTEVVEIFEPERLGSYVTKQQWDSLAYENTGTSREFKTSRLKAA
jgi:hypothetical protein